MEWMKLTFLCNAHVLGDGQCYKDIPLHPLHFGSSCNNNFWDDIKDFYG